MMGFPRIVTFVFVFTIGLLVTTAFGDNIYIDQLPAQPGSNWDGIDGQTYIGTPGTGRGYSTIQAGINAMSVGDTLYMRGGTYSLGGSEISVKGKNGTSWDVGGYFKMTSYPGEWAILDGERNTRNGVVLHGGFPCYGSDVASHYWWFERFEVKGGGYASGDTTCSGIWLNVGPFKFRYLYIHDNLSSHYGDNPAGLSATEMRDSLIEFCTFKNNGSDGATSHNCANICFYSEVLDRDVTATAGYSISRGGTRNNTVRYNYIGGNNGSTGIKHKIVQQFTGRTTSSPWSDTYKDFGDKIHHNFFDNLSRESLYICQDFTQAYQNIFNSPSSPAICVQYAPTTQFYKVAVYNNTIVETSGIAIVRYGKGDRYADELTSHYGYDFNNLIEGGQTSKPWGTQEIISVIPYSSGVIRHDLAGYVGSNNLFYNPGSNYVFRLYDTSYSASQYRSQTITGSQKIAYLATGDGLFLGNSGANQYKTNGSFIVESNTTIQNGGIGGSHPYLSGVSIPTFIGATDPQNDGWVEGVLSLANINTLIQGTEDNPEWIEEIGGSVPGNTGASIVLGLRLFEITAPTDDNQYATAEANIQLSGVSSGFSSVESLVWINSSGDSGTGTAQSDGKWVIDSISLQQGTNNITVTVTDINGRSGSDTITIVRE